MILLEKWIGSHDATYSKQKTGNKSFLHFVMNSNDTDAAELPDLPEPLSPIVQVSQAIVRNLIQLISPWFNNGRARSARLLSAPSPDQLFRETR
ncbi:hypothetical protein GWI33_016980 [Rhynchophorus ferrugineus]|uniref:Uncharacterized protein n=1 Tax=Rhynchophorus ferrugineus TaxID=354439 RepID=A0A834HZZ0_RHYFE|nr:hypothetical protein GWI33_016980 [Rhynchophorus ferrugineus]